MIKKGQFEIDLEDPEDQLLMAQAFQTGAMAISAIVGILRIG